MSFVRIRIHFMRTCVCLCNHSSQEYESETGPTSTLRALDPPGLDVAPLAGDDCLSLATCDMRRFVPHSTPNQCGQPPRRLRVTYRRCQVLLLHAPSAVLQRNLVHVAVAPAVVLGSRTVGMLMTHSLIIRGPTVLKLAQVGR